MLNFPEYSFRRRQNGPIDEIWDEVRKRWLVLTPEEWVRQHVVKYLQDQKGYSTGRMAIERGLKVNGMQRRTDVVVYNKLGSPHLIVECKAPTVKITQDVFDQIARYNLTLRVPYLLVTNGLDHYCCKIIHEESRWEFLAEIPMAE